MSVECPEVDEYRNNPWGMSATGSNGFGYGGYVAFTPKILADAAIAALEVRIADLEANDDERNLQVDLLITECANAILRHDRDRWKAEADLVEAVIERDMNYKTMVLYMEKKEQAEAELAALEAGSRYDA